MRERIRIYRWEEEYLGQVFFLKIAWKTVKNSLDRWWKYTRESIWSTQKLSLFDFISLSILSTLNFLFFYCFHYIPVCSFFQEPFVFILFRFYFPLLFPFKITIFSFNSIVCIHSFIDSMRTRILIRVVLILFWYSWILFKEKFERARREIIEYISTISSLNELMNKKAKNSIYQCS